MWLAAHTQSYGCQVSVPAVKMTEALIYLLVLSGCNVIGYCSVWWVAWQGGMAPDWVTPSVYWYFISSYLTWKFITFSIFFAQVQIPRLDYWTFKMSAVYWNVTLETRGATCVFLIIFLLVHSSRHTLSVPSRPPGATESKTLKSQSWINLITYLQAFIINERTPAKSVPSLFHSRD